MAAQSQGSNGVVGLIGLVIGAVVTAIFTRPSLDSGRPPEKLVSERAPAALQRLDARLWEDPFSALSGGDEAHGGQAPAAVNIKYLCSAINALRPAPEALLLLPVMASNAPYPDASEQRMRTRYAVQAGLAVEHFTPLDYEHIGRLDYDHPTGKLPVRIPIPFEIFERKPGQQNVPNEGASKKTQAGAIATRGALYVVVLWLNEEAFSPPGESAIRPIRAIERLAGSIGGCARVSPQVQTAVVGPARSDTLRAMVVEESCDPSKGPCADKPGDRRLAVYSPFATASAVDLLTLNDKPRQPRCKAAQEWLDSDWRSRLALNPRRSGSLLHDFFKVCGIDFFSTIATDQELGLALAKELQRRDPEGQGLRSDKYHVALVSEWDTYYGRMLPKAVMRGAGRSLEQACEDDPAELRPSEIAARPQGPPCTVHRFTYMRGLDGGVVKRAAEDKRPEASADGKTMSPSERAEGLQQLDYLRRLSWRIKATDRALRTSGHGWALSHLGRYGDHQIRAIGVLGVDVYDKISILRALVDDFPNAVFFTTDLDSRLLDRNNLPWTRNLVVVSSFGFRFSDCVQKGAPPFRGVYQSSAYLSTRLALYNAFSGWDTGRGALCPEDPDGEVLFAAGTPAVGAASGGDYAVGQNTIDVWLARPRIFELGLKGARDLSRGAPDAAVVSVGDVHPPAPSFMPDPREIVFSSVLLALTCFFVCLMPAVRRTLGYAASFLRPICTAGRVAWRRRLLVGALMGVVLILEALVLCAYLEATNNRGEPFAWVEGISAWPSELIRNLALVLTYVFLLAACGRLDQNNARIRTWAGASSDPVQLTFWQRLVGKLPESPSDTRDMRVFLNAYAELSAPRWCFYRAVLWTLVFWAIALLLMEELGYPALPVRGQSAALLDQFLILVLVPSFLVLLFLTVDATRLCERLSSGLCCRAAPTEWDADKLDLPKWPIGSPPGDLTARVIDAVAATRVIAKRTAAIMPMVYFPFVVLAMLVLARWNRFDHWGLPVGLLVITATTFVIASMAAWLLQRSASRARTEALDILERCLLERRGTSDSFEPTAPQIEQLIASVKSLHEGAFVPFLQQPAVVAALFPFASSLLPQIERLLPG